MIDRRSSARLIPLSPVILYIHIRMVTRGDQRNNNFFGSDTAAFTFAVVQTVQQSHLPRVTTYVCVYRPAFDNHLVGGNLHVEENQIIHAYRAIGVHRAHEGMEQDPRAAVTIPSPPRQRTEDL